MEENNPTPNQKQILKDKSFLKWFILIFIIVSLILSAYIYKSKILLQQNSVAINNATNIPIITPTPIDATNISMVSVDETNRLIATTSDQKDFIIDQNVSDWSDYVGTMDIAFKESNGIIFYGKKENNSKNENLYFYNINTNKKILIDTVTQTIDYYSWSSNGSYLAVSFLNPFGLASYSKKINIYNSTGKLVTTLSSNIKTDEEVGVGIGGWLSDNEFIYNQVQTPISSTTLNSSIALMSIHDNSNIEIKTIKESDSKNQYLFLSPRGENTISFEKITYKYKTIGSDGFASTLEKNTTYWRMDLDGKNLTQITEYEATV